MREKIEREESKDRKVRTKESKDNNAAMFGHVWFRNGVQWFRYGFHGLLMVS